MATRGRRPTRTSASPSEASAATSPGPMRAPAGRTGAPGARCGSGGDGAGDRQLARQVRRAHREAVHRRVVEGRQRAAGGHRSGEEAADRPAERDLFGVERADPVEDPPACVGHAQHGRPSIRARTCAGRS
jgi:hypothetical protein